MAAIIGSEKLLEGLLRTHHNSTITGLNRLLEALETLILS